MSNPGSVPGKKLQANQVTTTQTESAQSSSGSKKLRQNPMLYFLQATLAVDDALKAQIEEFMARIESLQNAMTIIGDALASVKEQMSHDPKKADEKYTIDRLFNEMNAGKNYRIDLGEHNNWKHPKIKTTANGRKYIEGGANAVQVVFDKYLQGGGPAKGEQWASGKHSYRAAAVMAKLEQASTQFNVDLQKEQAEFQAARDDKNKMQDAMNKALQSFRDADRSTNANLR